MKKKEKMITIIVAALVLVLAATLFVISNYRGEDGLTYSERKHLEKNGEAVVDWEAMEDAQQKDGFFARLFNKGDAADDDATSDSDTAADKDGKDSTSGKDSGSDSKNPASGGDTDSAGKDDSGSSSTGDGDSGKDSGDDSRDSKGDKDSSGSKDSSKGDSDSSSDKDKSPAKPSGGSEYEKYMAMSPEEQEAFFETFDSPEAFIKWFNNAKAKYESSNDSIVVEGGGIDIGDYQ